MSNWEGERIIIVDRKQSRTEAAAAGAAGTATTTAGETGAATS